MVPQLWPYCGRQFSLFQYKAIFFSFSKWLTSSEKRSIRLFLPWEPLKSKMATMGSKNGQQGLVGLVRGPTLAYCTLDTQMKFCKICFLICSFLLWEPRLVWCPYRSCGVCVWSVELVTILGVDNRTPYIYSNIIWSSYIKFGTNRQTDKQTNKQTNKQTDRQYRL